MSSDSSTQIAETAVEPGAQTDVNAEKTPAGAPESADTERGASDVAEAPVDDRPRWRRAVGRVPIELVILLVLGAITRFADLYDPRAIAFDENFFRGFALHYQQGTYYFDLHPPLGKELLGLWAWIAGIDAAPAGPDPAVAIRILPAFAGTLLIGVVYGLVRQLSGSRRIATLGAGLLLLDSAVLVESRFTFMDSLLLLFGLGAVYVALLARERTGKAYWWLLAASALLGGCATSVKLTGLACFGLVGVLWLVDVVRERRNPKLVIGQAVMLAVIPATIFIGSFAIHVSMLTKSGGTADGYMSQKYQSTLEGNANYRPDAKMSVIDKIVELNKATSNAQKALDGATHPNASKWFTWPIAKRSVFVWVSPEENGKTRYIYTLGNPAVWWGILLGAAIVAVGWIARPKRFKAHRWPLAFLALAWAVNFFPFALITRPMFLYHYFFALIFSLMFVVIGLGALTGWSTEGEKPFRFGSRRSATGYWAILAVALLSFLYFAPLIYGTPLTPEGLQDRMWLSTWR